MKRRSIAAYLMILCSVLFTGCGSSVTFFNLSGPEKWWVLKHPFIAHSAQRITRESRLLSREMEKDSRLDGDADGGTVDAFRHSYWMARLSQAMKLKKALDLGKAHEKANHRDFLKRKRREEKSVQDSIATAMDLFNNEIGAGFGNNHRSLPKDSLVDELISLILSGKMKIILKDANGRSLNCNGEVLDSTEYVFRWENERCLINSDKSRRH